VGPVRHSVVASPGLPRRVIDCSRGRRLDRVHGRDASLGCSPRAGRSGDRCLANPARPDSRFSPDSRDNAALNHGNHRWGITSRPVDGAAIGNAVGRLLLDALFRTVTKPSQPKYPDAPFRPGRQHSNQLSSLATPRMQRPAQGPATGSGHDSLSSGQHQWPYAVLKPGRRLADRQGCAEDMTLW
jgi:hypothetical protein